jgi:hypothetical protein
MHVIPTLEWLNDANRTVEAGDAGLCRPSRVQADGGWRNTTRVA